MVDGLEQPNSLPNDYGVEVGFTQTSLPGVMGPLAQLAGREGDEGFGFGVEIGVDCGVICIGAADQVLKDEEIGVRTASVEVGLEVSE